MTACGSESSRSENAPKTAGFDPNETLVPCGGKELKHETGIPAMVRQFE